jgi:hypothetical protein
MKRLSILLALVVTVSTTSARRPLEIRKSPVSATQVIDATHLRRHSKEEIEVVVVQQAHGTGMLDFNLDGRAIVKLAYGDWTILYLSPGRYRFGVVPSNNFGRATSWEMNADVSQNNRQLYRIFQSAGFTSSGGNAVYEIALY